MKKQFLREHHNRQEKTWKEPSRCPGADYGSGKPTRVWEQECKVEWDGVTPRFYWRTRYNEKIEKRICKEQMKDFFVAELRSKRYLVDGYKFKFTYDIRQFAVANQLSLAQAIAIYSKISDLAVGKLEIVVRRFVRAPLVFDYERRGADGISLEEVARVNVRWTDILQTQ